MGDGGNNSFPVWVGGWAHLPRYTLTIAARDKRDARKAIQRFFRESGYRARYTDLTVKLAEGRSHYGSSGVVECHDAGSKNANLLARVKRLAGSFRRMAG